MSRPLRVMWLGLRGFPTVQGGVETHAEHLCPLLAALGCEMHVITRSGYHPAVIGKTWKGVRFHPLWAPRSKGLEAILHTLLGVLYAGLVARPDVLHIQAIGPSIMTPLARLLGLKVIVTHHGPDYDRQKWGGFARFVLKLGERWGMKYANARIVISRVIENLVLKKHGVSAVVIPNAVEIPDHVVSADTLKEFGLEPGKYILLVSRMVPEKRHLDLIDAYVRSNIKDWKLVIVGASDHPDDYERDVLKVIEKTQGVVSTGFKSGIALKELYAHAGLFVLPSSHEGLPIALLEALSYGLPVVASAIPANLEVGLPEGQYFKLGDVERLSSLIRDFCNMDISEEARSAIRSWVASRYQWDDVAKKTLALYSLVAGKDTHARDNAL